MVSPFLQDHPTAWQAEKNLLELYGNNFHLNLLEWIEMFYPDYEGFKEVKSNGLFIFIGNEELMTYQYCHTVCEWWSFEQLLIINRYGTKNTPKDIGGD